MTETPIRHHPSRLSRVFLATLTIYAYSNLAYEFVPGILVVVSGLKAGADFILLLAGLHTVFRPENKFIKWCLAILLVISTITLKLNTGTTGWVTHFNGLREPLVLLISLSILTTVFHSDEREDFVRRINGFLMSFLVIQIPVTIYQFVRFGAGDQVGGTFSDGGSGMLSQVIFLSGYYLLVLRAGRFGGIGYNMTKAFAYLFLFVPVFINETKISFIYFAVVLLLQIRVQWNIVKALKTAVSAIAILFIFVKVLAMTTKIDLLDFVDPDVIDSYFLSDWTETEDITRFGKLFLTINDFDEDTGKHLFGIGYGLMKGRFVAGTSTAGKDYEALYNGSRMLMFSTYIQGGVALTALILVINVFYLMGIKSTISQYNLFRYHLFVICLFALMWIYNDALLVTYFNLFAAYFFVFIKYGFLSFPRNQSGKTVS